MKRRSNKLDKGLGLPVHAYRLYGLTVVSEARLPLPEIETEETADVTIRFSSDSPDVASFIDDGLIGYRLEDNCWWIHYRNTGTFCIDGTDTIGISPLEEVSSDLLQMRLLGAVFGLLLRRRGRLVLHANVVGYENEAILLLGPTGAGKSTITAVLGNKGYTILSDDLGVIDPGNLSVLPGPPRLKLRPESRQFLEDSENENIHVSAHSGKTTRSVEQFFEPVKVMAIFVLEPRGPVSVQKLGGRDAVLELVRHAHLPRSLEVTGCMSQHFTASSRLVQEVPCFELNRGNTLADLPQTVDLIEKSFDGTRCQA